MRAIVIALALASFVSAAHAATTDQAKDFLHETEYGTTEYMPELVARWHIALVAALKSNSDLKAAADTLAPQFDLSPALMLELAQLWVRYEVAWGENVEDPDEEDKIHAEFGTYFTALLGRTNHHALVLLTALYAMSDETRCDTSIFDALTQGAHDFAQTAFLVAAQSRCPNWFTAYAQKVPEKAAAALFMELRDPHGNDLTEIALTEILSRKALLAHVASKDRVSVRRRLAFIHIQKLMDVGLIDEALTYYDSLPARDHRALIEPILQPVPVMVDGLDLRVRRWSLWDRESSNLAENLAAAYYLKGNIDAAKKLAPADLLAAGHEALVCWSKRSLGDIGKKLNCDGHPDFHFEGELLDLILVHTQDDPYDFFELNYASSGDGIKPGTGSRLWAKVLCKYGEGGAYPDFCDEISRLSEGQVRWSTSLDHTYSPSPLDDLEPIIAIVQPDAAGVFEAYKTRIDAGLPLSRMENRSAANNATPPSRFQELPIPERYAGAIAETAPAWKEANGILPRGFHPVRMAREGKRIVIVSISQSYDPVGNVSLGGYWVHLSDDGGKTWSRPLYTGIADRDPYLVLPASKLPLIDGDELDLAVETEKVDPYSVTGPFSSLIGTITDRTDLYLHIPIAELMRDSDHDGITDIAEERLLLDPRNPDSDGDGIPDGSDMMPNVAAAKETAADQDAIAVLYTALFEPFARESISSPPEIKYGPDAAGIDQPFFLMGHAQTYGGLTPHRVIFVYNSSQFDRVLQMSPGFSAPGMGPIMFNRAHDRGYVHYRRGAESGCMRIYRDGNVWKVKTLYGWIT